MRSQTLFLKLGGCFNRRGPCFPFFSVVVWFLLLAVCGVVVGLVCVWFPLAVLAPFSWRSVVLPVVCGLVFRGLFLCCCSPCFPPSLPFPFSFLVFGVFCSSFFLSFVFSFSFLCWLSSLSSRLNLHSCRAPPFLKFSLYPFLSSCRSYLRSDGVTIARLGQPGRSLLD